MPISASFVSSSEELVDDSDAEFEDVSAVLSKGWAERRFRSTTRAKNGLRRRPGNLDAVPPSALAPRLVDGVSDDNTAVVKTTLVEADDDVPPYAPLGRGRCWVKRSDYNDTKRSRKGPINNAFL